MGAEAVPVAEPESLLPFLASFLEGVHLTPAEQGEVVHIARGFSIKDSASANDLSMETIRVRRKRIYSKLRVAGAHELNSILLGAALARLSDAR